MWLPLWGVAPTRARRVAEFTFSSRRPLQGRVVSRGWRPAAALARNRLALGAASVGELAWISTAPVRKRALASWPIRSLTVAVLITASRPRRSGSRRRPANARERHGRTANVHGTQVVRTAKIDPRDLCRTTRALPWAVISLPLWGVGRLFFSPRILQFTALPAGVYGRIALSAYQAGSASLGNTRPR